MKKKEDTPVMETKEEISEEWGRTYVKFNFN